MIKSRHVLNEEKQENIFWMTMTDLLMGLAIIFIVLFILAMTGFSQAKLQEQNLKSEVAQDLIKELKSKNINAQVDLTTGTVKLSDLQLFEVGSYNLSESGKAFLNRFVPAYLNVIFENSKISDKIVNIVIQGHTDSQLFANVESKDLQFIRNMELSTNRANEVAKYMFSTPYNKKYSNTLHKILVVEGKSYSEPVIVDGKEDYAKSRRVELKLVVKSSNLQDFMGLKNNEFNR
ncbi:OmpA family protein [bacterium]|nr:OmpA family protein [bacterium]